MELFALCTLRTAGLRERQTTLSKGATKALPFRRPHCSGPGGPSSVPVWTVVFGLRELIPLALAQVGPVEFGLGLCPLPGSGKVSISLRGSCSLEGPPKVGGHLVTQLSGSQAGQEGLNPGCSSGPFRFTSHGQNIRLIRSESPGLPADSQVISRKDC